MSLVSSQAHLAPATERARRAGRWALLLAFAVVYLVWGSTYLAIRFAVESIPPFLLMGSRSLVAGALLFGWVQARGGARLGAAHWREALLQGGFLFLGCHGALAWAEERVPSGQAALLFATLPGWMALGQWLGPERLRPGARSIQGLVLGLGGVAALTHPGEWLGARSTDTAGALALLFAALAWVIGSLRARHAPLPGGALGSAGASLLAGGLLLVLVGWLRGERVAPAEVSPRSLLALGYLIAFGTMLTLTSYLWLLKRTSPTLLATYAFVNPLVAVLLGAVFAGEDLGARIGVATALLIASVAMILSDRARTEPRT